VLYHTVSDYVSAVRSLLQDLIVPERYADQDIINALNNCIAEISRIRPDLFLDLKYQTRLLSGDLRDGVPALYATTDIAAGTVVPIPSNYFLPVQWYASGFLQLYDVTDTQDQRAAAFLERAKSMLMGLSL
jgi:hypothetical protein